MVWSYYQFNDAENKGRSTSTISIGVPETDNAIGYASCFAGSTAGLPQLEVAAPRRETFADTTVDVEFFGGAFRETYSGEIRRPETEEDYAGIQIHLDMDDPLWNAMQRMKIIHYRVLGEVLAVPLKGSRNAISNFLKDCRIYHGEQEQAGGNLSDDPRWETCEQYGSEVSRGSEMPVTVKFINRTDGHRGVLWIGFDGVPVDYAALNPGEEFSVDTYMNHFWMFTDGPGNCLEMFKPHTGIPVFELTAPNRYFGPE